MPAEWVSAFPLDELAVGGSRLVRAAGKQIAVFRRGQDTIYAVDNRCPHEGYPLVQGYVKDCLLTCAWHNFKFDLRDGRCVLGDEDVRTFPVRIGEGRVEIDVADPDPAERIPAVWRSLQNALLDGRMGQVARDLVRLLDLGVTPEELALGAARFDAARAEFGTTHVLPVARDVLEYTSRYHGVEAALPLMQVMELAAESNVRRPVREAPAPRDPGDDAAAAGARLRTLIENEEIAGAEALLRGALRKGWGRDVVQAWFLDLCADHFLDFGHALIYTIKACDLLDVAGWQYAEDILPALLYRIAVATREDNLPPWSAFRARLGEIEPGFAELLAQQRSAPPADWDRGAFLGLVLDGKDADMFEAMAASLALGVPVRTLVDALSVAAGERLGRFDTRHDRDVGVQDGWLFVTHLLTYANAVRYAMERHASPRALKHLFFLARFLNKAKPLDLPAEGRGLLAKVRLRETQTDALAQIVQHVREKKTPEAVSLVLKYLRRKRDVGCLRDALLDLALDDGAATRPIIVAHMIKMTVAAFDEHGHLEADPMREHPVLGLVRFLASPVVERFVGRASHEAIQFVVHGRVPRVLS